MNLKAETPLTSIDQIFALFALYGEEHYGEGVTQSLHMRQCAYLAEQEQAPSSLIAAALLHDIGHFVAYQSNAELDVDFHHERIGANLLKGLFDEQVWMPIAYHVIAKRYLCAIDQTYAANLSAASRQSLAVQGGAFNSEQASAFRKSPYFNSAIALRRYDDEAKNIGESAPPLDHFKHYLIELTKA